MKLFNKLNTLEALPPAIDGLHGHIVRAKYRNLIWRQWDKDIPQIPPSTYFGWKVESGHLVAKLSTLPPDPKALKTLSRTVAARVVLPRAAHGKIRTGTPQVLANVLMGRQFPRINSINAAYFKSRNNLRYL